MAVVKKKKHVAKYKCYECNNPCRKLYDKEFCEKCFTTCILGKNRTLEMGRKITSEWYEKKITEYKEKNKQALILLQEMW